MAELVRNHEMNVNCEIEKMSNERIAELADKYGVEEDVVVGLICEGFNAEEIEEILVEAEW